MVFKNEVLILNNVEMYELFAFCWFKMTSKTAAVIKCFFLSQLSNLVSLSFSIDYKIILSPSVQSTVFVSTCHCHIL